MSCAMIPFTQCRFCDDAGQGGELFLDPHEVWELYSKRKEWGPAPDNLRQIIKHDSPRTGIGVCPHLLDIDLMIVRCGPDRDDNDIPIWEIQTSWVHPLFDAVDPADIGRYLMSELEWENEPPEFLPDEPHQFDSFWESWPDFTEPGRFFRVRGTAVFASDASEFIAALVEKAELLQKARRAGRDTRAEWEVIKKLREETDNEYDYEDAYEELPSDD